jgi:hypothetical protein
MTTRTEAYDFFCAPLSRKVIQLQNALDNAEIGSAHYASLTDDLIETQRLFVLLTTSQMQSNNC